MAKRTKSKGSSYWRAQLANWSRSDLSQVEFCRRQDLTLSTFRWWRRKLQIRQVGPLQDKSSSKAVQSPFLPVHLLNPIRSRPLIEIHLPGNRRIHVPPGFDPETLKEVLAVLEGCAC